VFGLDIGFEFFQARRMARAACTERSGPFLDLRGIVVELIKPGRDKARCRRKLAKHHYLGDVRAVGEQLFYAIKDALASGLGSASFVPLRADCGRVTSGSAGPKNSGGAVWHW
jgi:hypothetical protein